MQRVIYNNVEFETEHEAVCSALFTNYGWKWERPRSALSGWLPDFRLNGNTVVYVECKGGLGWDDVRTFKELQRYEDAVSGTNYEVLLIPKSPVKLKNRKGYVFSTLGYLYDKEVWSYAELGRWSGNVGFCHSAKSWRDRMSGEDLKKSSGDGRAPNVEMDWLSATQIARGKRVTFFQGFINSEIEEWDAST